MPQTPNPLESFKRLEVSVSALLEHILAGKLKLTISKTFPLEQAAEAHKYIESRQSFGKVLLRL